MFISFGSIEQLRNVAKEVEKFSREFKELDENNNPIYDFKELPVVKAIATEKIHGTNGAVCKTIEDGEEQFWVQSRKRIITVEQDNAGCATDALYKKKYWDEIIDKLVKQYNIDLSENYVSVYFEWAGENIQKNACIEGFKKSAFILDILK